MHYLEVDHVLALHAEVMVRLRSRPQPLLEGGRSRLEAALARPQHAAFYAEADLCLQAALLGIGMAQAHAFKDGNKRTATVAMVIFLGLAGLRLHIGVEMEFAHRLEKVLAERGGDAEVQEMAAWLRAVCEPGR